MKNLISSFGLTLGTLTNSLLGLAFYLLVARNLEVSQFGDFSLVLGIGLIIAEIGDLGIGSSLIKFGSAEKFFGIFFVALIQRLFISSLVLIIFNFVNIQAGIVGASLLLLSFITQSFLARQKYFNYVLTNIFGNVCRLLLFYFAVTPLTSFYSANLLASIIGVILLLPEINFKQMFKNFRENLINVWNYSRYVAISFSLASLGAKLDIPLVYALSGSYAAGVYSGASKLISVFPQIASSVEAIFAPKFSKDTSISKSFNDYRKISILISIITLAVIPFSDILIKIVFSQKYDASIIVFKIMLLGIVFMFLTGPSSALILYKHGRSKIHMFGSVVSLIVSVALMFILIPNFGAIGAGISFTLVLGTSLLFFSYYAKE